MISTGIVIPWDMGTEYISLDILKLSDSYSIESTREWWSHKREVVQYNTASRVKRRSNGHFEITLTYRSESNPHIKKENACWGVSTIKFDPSENVGTATWVDFDNEAHNGTIECQLKSNELFKEAKLQRTTKLQREQEEFRIALLSYDQCCSLTGESTVDALEAAHIIPSKDLGNEVIENGILLRSDIHKLYDKGKFLINPDGFVVSVKGVSKQYSQLLSGAKLPQKITQRVQSALRHQWRKQNPKNI